VREGLYKVDFHTVHGSGCGVIHAIGGRLRGGNSAFAFIGNYQRNGETISAKVSTLRFNHDPDFKSLFGFEGVTLTLSGTPNGDMVDFEGTALQAPGVNFKAVLTHLSD
jgi:T3SS negative regulator,GrlR